MSFEPSTRRWISNGEVRLAVAEYGPPNAPPVVALHGFPESSTTWGPVAELLVAGGRRVVAPDLRGHGASDAPRLVRAYRIERLLDDVEAVIEDIGGAPVEMLAHDWGGALAWLLAERRPHLLERAVILNVPHPAVLRRAIFTDPDQRKRSGYIIKMQIPVLPERRLSRNRAAALAGLFPAEHYPPDTIEHYRTQWTRRGVMRGMLNWYRAAARDRSLLPPATPIAIPLTILWGRDDPLFTAGVVEDSLELCSAASVRYLDRCGHAPHRERPQAVAEAVLGTPRRENP
ncbi:MAG: alpha/beta fold hydrolase [Acidimicrobiia bacterium]|nr:alpha/beta fold hydrolase [Acidimicrobiia bacterium]